MSRQQKDIDSGAAEAAYYLRCEGQSWRQVAVNVYGPQKCSISPASLAQRASTSAKAWAKSSGKAWPPADAQVGDSPEDIDKRMPVLRARVPAPLLNAVDQLVARTGQNRSELLRSFIVRGLSAVGEWPPKMAAEVANG